MNESSMYDTAWRRWAALAALCLATLMVMIDNTIVNVALPSISRDLSVSSSSLQWVVDAYTLAFAGLLITAGHCGDRWGRRRVLLCGVAGFAVISVAAALATSATELIIARAGLGIFAALVFPATLAMLTVIFDNVRERAAAFGMWAATSGVAVAIGPVLGGWLIERFSWSAVFWVNIPIAAIVAIAVVATVHQSRVSTPGAGPIDWFGLALSIVAMVALIYTVIEAPEHGWGNWLTIGGFIGAAVLLTMFVWRQLTAKHPVIDVRVFRNREFSAAAGLISVAFFSLFGFIFLVTQYFQAVKGYGTLSAGLHTLPFAIVMAIVSPIAMAIVRRMGVAAVASLGALLMAAGFALVELADADASYWGLIVWSMSLMAAGLGCISGPCTHVVMNALPAQTAGAGAAINDTTREFGGALGVAVLGSALSSVYSAGITNSAVLKSLPGQAHEAMQSSVMAAISVLDDPRIPSQARDPLLAAVRSVFVDGLHSAVWVAVAIAAVTAPIAYWGLRATPVEVMSEPAGPTVSDRV